MRKQGQSQEEYCKGCVLNIACNVILEDDESCEDKMNNEGKIILERVTTEELKDYVMGSLLKTADDWGDHKSKGYQMRRTICKSILNGKECIAVLNERTDGVD